MKNQNYVYPKLAKNDFWLFNVNSSGLANLLYMYARALIYAKKNNLEIIWPTWFSFQLDRILKCKKEKRWYNDLFINRSGYIGGWKKLLFLATKKKILITQEIPNNLIEYKNTIFCFWGFYGHPLESIKNDSSILLSDLKRNLHPKNLNVFEYDYTNKIGIHIRLDDFRIYNPDEISNKVNSRIPLPWYINTINRVRKVVGIKILIEIYSDGTDEELSQILTMPNVKRHTFGTAIADMLALSQYKLLIGSGSTFSVMARYLGRMDSISPTNQITEYVLIQNDQSREIELGMNENIPDFFNEKIATLFADINNN